MCSVSLNSMQWVLYHCFRITSGSSVTPNSLLSALRFATSLYVKLGAILSEYYVMSVIHRFLLESYENSSHRFQIINAYKFQG